MEGENDKRYWDFCYQNIHPVDNNQSGLKRPNNSYPIMGTGCAEANVRTSDILDIRLGVSNVALDLGLPKIILRWT